ncbi:MAG: tyrosine-protein phosphatase [Janthinobacterium lividum]
MIDIHHHLLPGIDDGSRDLATSLAMVQMAVEDGITHIVATPHANHTYSYDRDRNQGLLDEIRNALPDETRKRVQLGLGCDFHLNFENVEDARVNGTRYTINQTEYLLVELPDFNIPTRLDEVLYNLRVAGLTPILTHPERNGTLQRSPERLTDWIKSGLLVQVTAGSVLGAFGTKARDMAWRLLRAGSVQFLATDAHDTVRRPPRMMEARVQVEKRLGAELADLLCVGNPLAVFEGRPLPTQPSLRSIENEDGEGKSIWKRLFGGV